MSKDKWVEHSKFKPGFIAITPENEEQHGFEKGTFQSIQDTFFGKTEDADFEIVDNSNCVFDVEMLENRMKELGYLEEGICEIIPDEPLNEKIEWNDLPEDNEAPTLSRNLLDEAGLWEDKDREERKKIAHDMMHFGFGVYKNNEDGTIERLDPLSDEATDLWNKH